MADIGALRQLHDFMREVNASYARSGELELRLEPAPPQPIAAPSPPSTDPVDEQRRLLADLLHSSGGDPEPFIEAQRRLAARNSL